MNRNELQEVLQKASVPSGLYNLDMTGRDDERFCLSEENQKWVVYYSERGVRTTEEIFDTEDEACRYILKRFKISI